MSAADFKTEEEILAKHRQEKKNLQVKIQSMKKSSPKGDKRKKKEICDTILSMEAELEAKHKAEIAEFISDPLKDDPTETKKEQEVCSQNATVDSEVTPNQRISRAQKRRNKKVEDEKERNKRISEQDELNKQGPRVRELETIKGLLRTMNLQIFNIPADGNCLYCAVNHQLKTTGRSVSDVNKLRKLTAQFMLDNRDDFLPFMYNEDEEPFDKNKFDSYCKEVATTKLWGGQLEIRALSNALRCPIKIIQATGPQTLQGERYDGVPLIITYHRHLYRLGEHYNSTLLIDNALQSAQDTDTDQTNDHEHQDNHET